MKPKEELQLTERTITIHDDDEGLVNEEQLIEVNDDIANDIKALHSNKGEPKEDLKTQEEDQEEEQKKDQDTEVAEENIEDDAQEEKTKKHYRHSERHRIHALTKQVKEAQSSSYLNLKAKEEAEKYLLLANKDKIDYYEKYIKAEKKNILAALQNAEDEGDSQAKAEILDLLSQYNSRLEEVSKDKHEIQNILSERYVENKYHHERQQQEPKEYVDPQVQKISQEWLRNNQWADVNSTNFDEEMYKEADSYSIALAKTYKLDGKALDIGSREFYDDITDYINGIYRVDMPQARSQNSPQVKRPAATMNSPVNRTNNMTTKSMQIKPKTFNDIKLTNEEIQNAYGLISAKVATDRDDAIKKYKQEKFKIMLQEGRY